MPIKIAIIGAGLSGLSTAYLLGKKLPEADISVYEKNASAGGKVISDTTSEFTHEKGPNGFLSSRREIYELCQELGLDVLYSNQDAAIRYLWMDGQLKSIPNGPGSMMLWPELSLKTKLSLMGDLFQKARTSEDESLYEFVSKQFTEEFAMKIADPFVAGVFAADCKKLSMRSAFPAVFDAQRKHGSVIKGMKASYKEKVAQGKAPAKRKRGRLCSIRGGMVQLPLALAQKLNVHYQSEVTDLRFTQKGASVKINGEEQDFDIVIMASPGRETANILHESMPRVAQTMKNIEYTPVGVGICGFRKKLNIPRGFGFLVPSHEESNVLGVLFSSQIFPENHAEGYTTLRVMYGGTRKPELLDKSDDEIQKIIQQELKNKLGISEEIDHFQNIPWKRAIPMYPLGFYKEQELVQKALNEKALFITGTSLYGVSLNDCVVSAQDTVEKTLAYLRSKND